jgi:hypothetical protein
MTTAAWSNRASAERRLSISISAIDHAQILDSLQKHTVVIESGFKG